jgi:hypothetical protein
MDKHDAAKRVALYVDEWGTWFESEPGASALYQQSSLRDAMVAALSFNVFHRHTERVKMANIAQMVNVLQSLALTDGPRMVLTPTYHVFDLYQPFKGATPLAAKLDAPRWRSAYRLPAVASVARAADGSRAGASTRPCTTGPWPQPARPGSGRVLTAAAGCPQHLRSRGPACPRLGAARRGWCWTCPKAIVVASVC